MAKGGRFKIYGHSAGKLAVPVYVCDNMKCGLHNVGVRRNGRYEEPEVCLRCGGYTFTRFASISEANRWASLRLQENQGDISDLRRQVRFSLQTKSPDGLMVHVAYYIADFVYVRQGEEIIEDVKSSSDPRHLDPIAELKFRWIKAQYGKEVKIYAS